MQTEYGALFKIEEIKASETGGWEVAGYASTFGNVDHGGDVVMRGAFDASIAQWKAGRQKIRFLYAHDTFSPLGVVKSLSADDRGLLGTFKISKTTLGEDVHTWLKDGALDSFSIGYIPTDVEFDDVGVRKLMAVDLLECSVVSIPMNDQAEVTRVKSAIDDGSIARLPLAEHTRLVASAGGSLTERWQTLLSKLLSDGHALTETKQQELEPLLEMLSKWDAVRPDAEKLLHPAPVAEEAQLGDLKLRLQLARKLSIQRGLLVESAA